MPATFPLRTAPHSGLRYLPLSDCPHLLPVIAGWYYAEWGAHVAGIALHDEMQKLEVFLQSGELPLLLVALDGDTPIAAAQLKFNERTEHPDRLHWLGGVYVVAAQRGHAVAAALVEELIRRSALLGVREVFLQTEADNGGLYRRLGWQPLESVIHAAGMPVRIMVRELSRVPPAA